MISTVRTATPHARPPAVAGTFYPAEPAALSALVTDLLLAADARAEAAGPARRATSELFGLLVPHAGLEYSGLVAAAGWRSLRELPPDGATEAGSPKGAVTVVILGTNHRAGWLRGVGAWDREAWLTPLGSVPTDADLAQAIVGLGPPFIVDRSAHLREHAIEVQLPLLQAVMPDARIVPLAVAAGTGQGAIEAGERLGSLLAARRRPGDRLVLAISSDLAHYPPHAEAARVTDQLLPAILALDPKGLADRESALVAARIPGLLCGMCGIEPTVLGLAALRAAGAAGGSLLAAATSADAGGPPDRTVGYLAVRFDASGR